MWWRVGALPFASPLCRDKLQSHATHTCPPACVALSFFAFTSARDLCLRSSFILFILISLLLFVFLLSPFLLFFSSLLLVLQADPGSSRQCCTYRIHPAILPTSKRSSLVFTPPSSTIALIKDWCFVACTQGLDYRLSSTVPSLVTQRSHRSATLRSTLLSALHPPSPSPPHAHNYPRK